MSEQRARLLSFREPGGEDGIARAAMLMPDGTEIVCTLDLVNAAHLVERLGALICAAASRERDQLRARRS